MRRELLLIAILTLLIPLVSCGPKAEPEGVIKGLISPDVQFSNHLYYRETRDGKTAIFRIAETSSDISTIIFGLEGVRDCKSSDNAVYILQDDSAGYLKVTRLEKNRAMLTEAVLDVDLKPGTEPRPWAVSREDNVFVAGIDNNNQRHIIEITFSRTEAERTFEENEVLVPKVTNVQEEWLVTSDPVGAISVTDDGSMLAMLMPGENNPDPSCLYFLTGPNVDPILISEGTVLQLGGFSSDKMNFAFTYNSDDRTDLYMVRTRTGEVSQLTNNGMGYYVQDPRWHPNGKYIIYATDFSTEFVAESTPLSGDQLFLYSIVSDNERRLTAYQDQNIWIDFGPTGDFLMYSSTPGVTASSGRGIPDDPEEETDDTGLETWRLSIVEWDDDDFVTSNMRTMTSEEIEPIATWTHGANVDIEFFWGPKVSGL